MDNYTSPFFTGNYPFDPRVEQMRVAYANIAPNISIPEESLRVAAATGSAPFMVKKGERYFLKEDPKSIEKRKKDERYAPTYSYQSPTAGRLGATFMELATYGKFGMGGYSPNVQARREARGQNPYGPESTGVFAPRTGQRGPATEPWQQREEAARIKREEEEAARIKQEKEAARIKGMTGDPLSFTGFGQMAGMAPQPSATIAPPAQSPFYGNRLGSLTGFGGIPLFPYY